MQVSARKYTTTFAAILVQSKGSANKKVILKYYGNLARQFNLVLQTIAALNNALPGQFHRLICRLLEQDKLVRLLDQCNERLLGCKLPLLEVPRQTKLHLGLDLPEWRTIEARGGSLVVSQPVVLLHGHHALMCYLVSLCGYLAVLTEQAGADWQCGLPPKCLACAAFEKSHFLVCLSALVQG